jgi:FemAB-related protein (PEP-CTERM system-associated)
MPEVRIRKLAREQAGVWPDALALSATFNGLDPWSDLVRETYGYDIHRFEALRNGEVVGLLVLTHVRHFIFGNYLATAPFGSYGGFAFTSVEARDALLREARILADTLEVDYVVVRFLDRGDKPAAPWIQHPIYATYFMSLPRSADELWGSFGSKHRKHTRQALRKGYQLRVGHLELLDDAYEVLARSMHELGSPYHSNDYLRRMATLLGKQLEFLVVSDAEGRLAGAAVLIYQDGVASSLHANILRSLPSDYAGEFLYWSMIEHSCKKGMKIFDLGRSLNGSGNEAFKTKWRPRKEPLAYWYYLPKGGAIPAFNQRSPRLQLAIRIWKLLPAFIARAIGPSLIRGIV